MVRAKPASAVPQRNLGGEKFFQLLARLAENPGQHRELLELTYLCLALGFEGRFRVQDNGCAQIHALRERLYRLLKGLAPPAEAELSPRWAGTSGVRNPQLGWLPMCVVAVLLGLLLVGVYLALSYRLNRPVRPALRLDPSFARARHGRRRPSPRRAWPDCWRPKSAPAVWRVQALGDRGVVTLRGDGLFEAGSASPVCKTAVTVPEADAPDAGQTCDDSRPRPVFSPGFSSFF